VLAALAVLAGVALLIGPAVLGAALRDVGALVLAAAIAAVAWCAGRRSQPAARAGTRPPPARPLLPGMVPAAERDQLAAELARARAALADARAGAAAERGQLAARVADLGRQLADARASAEAAWDAAADRPPSRRVTDDTLPLAVLGAEQLAATPMSGARPLGGR
jgi:hypothetical protein